MDQTPTQWTAATVRAELARRQITGRALGRALGWSHGTTTRRLNGETAFTVPELVAIADHIGVPTHLLLPSGSTSPKALSA